MAFPDPGVDFATNLLKKRNLQVEFFVAIGQSLKFADWKFVKSAKNPKGHRKKHGMLNF